MDISRFREAIRQGCIDPWAASVCWKDSPSTPPAPNYQAAAQAQQYNQVTPFGSSTWTPATTGTSGTPGHYVQGPGGFKSANAPGYGGYSGGVGGSAGGANSTWVPGTPATQSTPAQVTTSLSPQLQSTLDSIMGRASSNLSTPPNLQSVNDISNQAYSAMTSRLDPQWAQNEEMQKTQLANQGLAPGGEAYDNAMRVFNQGKNDAYQQANLGAIQTMPQTYQLAMDQYNQPLNQLNALRTGAQISGPQAPQTPDYLQAAGLTGQYNQGLYNAQVGQQNAMTSGLFGLGSAGLLGYMMM